MKIKLKREEKGVDIVNFYVVFEPENVEETLLLKELEQKRDESIDYRPQEWDGTKFNVFLT